MHLVVFEASYVDVSILHIHLSLLSHISLPLAFELSAVCPCDNTIAISLASLPLALVFGLFIITTSHRRKAIVVIHCTKSTRTAIFKVASVFISIFVVDDA